MSFRVELSKKEEREIELIKQMKMKPAIAGHCAQCNRALPEGYLALVTKWESHSWGSGMKVAKPKVMYCKECVPSASSSKKSTEGKQQKLFVEDKVNGQPLDKALAGKLIAVMSKVKAHSPRWMIKRAKLNVDKKDVITTLKKLYADGTIEHVDGQWLLK